jgi:hypothetical protein
MNPPPYRPPEGDKNNIMRQVVLASLIALPVVALFVFVAILAVKQQRKQMASRAAWQDVKSSAGGMRDDLKKNFNPTNGITNVDLSRFDKMRDGLKTVSQNSSGDDGHVAKALSAYLDRMQTAVKNYQDASTKLRETRVLDNFDSTDKQQIPARREVVQQFIAGNEALKFVITNSEDRIRADLARENVPASKIDRFMEGFHSSAAPKNAASIKIRQCDDRIGAAMLDALSALESDWGHWKSDPATDRLRFEHSATLNTYNKDLASIQAAGEEQLKLQTRLINQPSSQP